MKNSVIADVEIKHLGNKMFSGTMKLKLMEEIPQKTLSFDFAWDYNGRLSLMNGSKRVLTKISTSELETVQALVAQFINEVLQNSAAYKKQKSIRLYPISKPKYEALKTFSAGL